MGYADFMKAYEGSSEMQGYKHQISDRVENGRRVQATMGMKAEATPTAPKQSS